MLCWLLGLMYHSSACADGLARARLQIGQIVLSTFWLQAGTLPRDAKQYVAFHDHLAVAAPCKVLLVWMGQGNSAALGRHIPCSQAR